MTEETKKRGPGRPPKVKNVEVEVVDEGNGIGEVQLVLPRVKNVIRWISRMGFTDVEGGQFESVEEVDNYLDAVSEHYDLFDTHYLGENPEAFGVMYIFKLKS